jgi:von Willebrand factor type A domain
MMNLYKSKVNIGGKEKYVVAINYKQEKEETQQVSVERLHHIHILDRSYSMYSDLPQLIENVKDTLTVMDENDLISVIWFSGEGECKTVFKGKSKRDMDDIKVMLDALKHPVGMTCFSESLEASLEVIEDLKVLCPNFSITFFTDGQPVVHDYDKEMRRIKELTSVLGDEIMALNVIGYGNYYNKELLSEMSESSTFGRLIHSSQINDYSEIFSHNYEILSTMAAEKVRIETDKESQILYLTNKNTKLEEGVLELDFLSKIKNQFFIITEDEDTVITLNDDVVNVKDITGKVNSSSLNNLLYSLVYEYYYKGLADESLDIAHHSLHDKAIIDNHMKAFTAKERQDHTNFLESAIFQNKNRLMDGEADASYVPSDDAFSVMDLLKLLSSGDNYYVPLSSKEYNRIGLKVTDEFNLFQADKEKTPLAPMNELVFNQKHLNISIKYMIEGTVKINPKEAKRVDLPSVIDSRIFRTQTIIKDGNLNIAKMKVLVSKDSYDRLMVLHSQGVVDFSTLLDEVDAQFDEEGSMNVTSVMVTFNLDSLPIINRMYAQKSTPEQILYNVKSINAFKAQQKVYNYYIKSLEDASYTNKKSEQFTPYNADQIRVLEAHGLNQKLDYQGVDLVKNEKSENDFYESRLLEFSLSGWSSLPKVEDVIKKVEEDKKLNAPGTAMYDTIQFIENLKHNTASNKELLQSIKDMRDGKKQEILKRTIDLNTQKIAKVITGGWWTGLELDKKENYVFTQDKDKLVIKNDMIKVFYG